MKPPRPSLALLTALLRASIPVAHAAENALFTDDFDRRPTGPISPGSLPGIIAWDGPSGAECGWTGVTDEYPAAGMDASARNRVVALHDNTAVPDRGRSLQFEWPGRAPASGRVSAEWRFLAVDSSNYLGVFFLGNHWNDSPAAILLANGNILHHHDQGDASRKFLGACTAGKWHALKVDLDVSARTLAVWLDGRKTGAAWLAQCPKPFDRLCAVADFAPTDRAGAPVLYLDDVKVTAVS